MDMVVLIPKKAWKMMWAHLEMAARPGFCPKPIDNGSILVEGHTHSSSGMVTPGAKVAEASMMYVKVWYFEVWKPTDPKPRVPKGCVIVPAVFTPGGRDIRSCYRSAAVMTKEAMDAAMVVRMPPTA
jgi:hypothetical protein